MDQEVVRRRNAVFNAIYERVLSLYSQCVPKPLRWILEVLFLLMALVTFSLWSYVHFTYVVDPADCLAVIQERPFSNRVILQVEVYSNTTQLWNKVQSSSKEMYPTIQRDGVNDHKNMSQWMMPDRKVENEESATDKKRLDENMFEKPLYELLDIYTLRLFSVDYAILEFSQEPGYLSLTQETRKYHNISTKRLYIDPEKVSCFGGSFGRFITKYFFGYEMMIISSFKNLLPIEQGLGYVKNLLTGSHYYYHVQWMNKWRYITGLLPTFFFTLVASILLRQIHYHGFRFLTHFHHLLNEGIPMPIHTGAQVPFLIITYAAIGLVIVMSEALGDDSLFSLLMVGTVWEADQFYALFCRHKMSKRFFPMFFFLYHAIPYAYFVRFNGQFWFLSFLFHWFLLQNAVLIFFHHFEVKKWNAVYQRPRHQEQEQAPLPPAPQERREQDGTVYGQRLQLRPQEQEQAPLPPAPQERREQDGTVLRHQPIEESLTEERSALFINTQSNILRHRVASGTLGVDNHHDGLRERQIL